MELLKIFATLWQRRLLVLLGLAAALAIAAAPGASSGGRSGAALSRVLIDTPDSMLVELGPRGTLVSGMRTALLADLMLSDRVKAKIARAAGVPDQDLLIRGASSDPPLAPGPLAERASIATAGVTAPYAISVRPEGQVPIIAISVYAPDAGAAARVARAATSTLQSLNTAPEDDTSGAVIKPLGPVVAQDVISGASSKLGMIAGVMLFAFWCAAIVLCAGLARWWRTLAVRDALAPPLPRPAAGESLAFAISVVASDLRRAWQQVAAPMAVAGPRLVATAASARGAVAAAPGHARRAIVHPLTVTGLSMVLVFIPALGAFLALEEGGSDRVAQSSKARPLTPATPATLERVFDAARGGDTIALAAGDYGTFAGGSKDSTVTLVAQAGATVSMAVDFDPADHIRIEGVTLTSLELDGDTHDVTIAKSKFTGPALIRADEMAGADILLDGNKHAGIDKCDGCYEGRLTITGDSGKPAGILIRGSTFGPRGLSDGILNGGRGVQIVGNHFVGLQGGSVDGVHVDAIQLYGSYGTIIRGNRIEDVATGIMAPDGADHEVIEHNFIAPGEYPFAIFLAGDVGSQIRHNKLPDGECAFDKMCGTIVIESSKEGVPSTGTIVTDNILGELAVGDGSTLGAAERNTIASDPSTDPGALGSTDALGIG